MKKMIVFVFCAVILIAAVAFNATPTKATKPAADNASVSRVQRGFQIAPVPLHTQGRNRAQIGLGSYLVNAVSECNDCHSCPTFTPGHNPFDGVGDGALNQTNHLAGGVNFGPGEDGEDIISKNLTPDENGKPAGLDFDEFVKLIRTGHDPDEPSDEVLEVMPWPFFRHMTTSDLRAIYEYLRAIPHAEPGTCSGPGQ
jgi:hypothetical protein